MLCSKRRKNLGGGRRKRSNRRSYGLKRYNKYGGNPLQQPIIYNVETILNNVLSFKGNNTHFEQYCCGKMGKILYDKTKDATFYENNLCVFVEFNTFIKTNADRLYLGKMISSYDDYTKYGVTVQNLQFQCDLLYSYSNRNESFNQEIMYNTGDSRVIIGFLPIAYKEIVLEEAKKVRQS
jgi:spore coat protein CotF